MDVDFRGRLLSTLRAAGPVLEVPGVLVVGSEVPNLLEEGAASTLVVSQDVDLSVPIARHSDVKRRLGELRSRGLEPSADEPSVWVPTVPHLLEVNFVGRDDVRRDPTDVYVFDDPELPLLVFGALGLVEPGEPVRVEDLVLPMPRIAGLLAEKLVTDRTGEKGDRDLLVALGLLNLARDADLEELEQIHRRLPPELRHGIRSNLSILSLLDPRPGMPDPRPGRERVMALLYRLEIAGGVS